MKAFKIYFVEIYQEENCYIAVRKNILGKEIAEEINFDIDPKGGLKIIHLGKEFDLHVQNGIRKTLLFDNVKRDFIPIEAYPSFMSEDKLTISKKFYDILENGYLKYKEKYFIVNGVILKTKFDRIYDNPYYECKNYNYKILMS